MLSSLGFVNLSFVQTFRVQCRYPGVNYIREMLYMTLGPIVVVAILWLHFFVVSLIGGRKSATQKAKRFAAYMHLFLLITYLVLVGSSTKVLHFFKCEELLLPDDSSILYLAADMSIDCDSNEYESHIVFALLMVLVFPIGIPSLYFTMAYSQRHILSEEAEVRNEEADELLRLERLGGLARR